jgi:hypothetical protein
MNNDIWIIEWQDISGDTDHDIKVVAHSSEDAVERVRLILAEEIVVDDEAIGPDRERPPGAERPAFDALFEGEDPVTALRELRDDITHESDGGKIIITRCQSPHPQEQ